MANGGGSDACIDWIGGIALGLLLGALIGLSVTPVVSIVVTALVGLLAGLFGLGDKPALGIASSGARRLAGFGIAAVIATPIAVWARTNDVLGPSLDSQRATLRAIGIDDGTPEQKTVLLALRFGMDVAGKPAGGEAARRAGTGVLYAGVPAGLCAKLQMSGATADLLTSLDGTDDPRLKTIAAGIRAMKPDAQASALDYARLFLCDGG